MQFQSVVVGEEDSGKRLDIFLSELMECSRSHVKSLHKNGHIRVNREIPKKVGVSVGEGDEVAFRDEVPETELKPEAIPLEIIFEDKDLLVINKAPGMVVHPDGTGHSKGTVVNAVLAHCQLSQGSEKMRPGVVHRLDKDTSGVLLIAKSNAMHEKLNAAFRSREVEKIYWALVKGTPKTDKGRLEAPIKRSHKDRKKMNINAQGKMAISSFEVLQNFKGCSLLEVKIETGRTHQIRVHLASIGHPVIGDLVYGEEKINHKFKTQFGLTRQFLHAKKLSVFGKSFEAPLSSDLESVLTQLS